MTVLEFLERWQSYYEIIDDDTNDVICSSENEMFFNELLPCKVLSANLIFDSETETYRMSIRADVVL